MNLSKTSDMHSAGQALVIMVLAMVAMLAMTALVVDGGNAFVQQRSTQNGADAAAEAGAVVLAENLAGGVHTDQEVLAAVTASAAQNAITLSSAIYTNVNGNSLGVTVGSLGATVPPANYAGVRALTARTFSTYAGGIVGINQLNASAEATAVAGASAGCTLSQGCTLLPITFPTIATVCDGTNNQVQVGTGPYGIVDVNHRNGGNEAILGICKTAHGSVGWLDFQGPTCGNGSNGLICEIKTPDFGTISFPTWVKTETGNTNDSKVESAINAYAGQVILIPFYDCIKDNVSAPLSPGPKCPSPAQSGNGSNTYYHILGVYGFYLDQAYINGNNPECNKMPGQPPVGGNGGTGCIKGWFVQPLSSGAVGPGPVVTGADIAVQLVR